MIHLYIWWPTHPCRNLVHDRDVNDVPATRWHFPYVPWLIHICLELIRAMYQHTSTWLCLQRHTSFMLAMTHSCWLWLIHAGYDSFMLAMTHSYWLWLIHMCHDSFICAMTHSYVPWLMYTRHDAFVYAMTDSYVPWLIHICHDSFIYAMTHSYMPWLAHMWNDSCRFGTIERISMTLTTYSQRVNTLPYVSWLTHMSWLHTWQIRNKLVHDRDFNEIPDRPEFVESFDQVHSLLHAVEVHAWQERKRECETVCGCIRVNACVGVWVKERERVSVGVSLCVGVFVCARVHVCMCLCVYIYICIYKYMYIYSFIYFYMYVYILT